MRTETPEKAKRPGMACLGFLLAAAIVATLFYLVFSR